MSGKKISLGPRPTAKPLAPAAADQWVESRNDGAPGDEGVPAEPMKRLTIDIPASLHKVLKTDCAQQDTTIADVIRDLLIKKYGKT